MPMIKATLGVPAGGHWGQTHGCWCWWQWQPRAEVTCCGTRHRAPSRAHLGSSGAGNGIRVMQDA